MVARYYGRLRLCSRGGNGRLDGPPAGPVSTDSGSAAQRALAGSTSADAVDNSASFSATLSARVDGVGPRAQREYACGQELCQRAAPRTAGREEAEAQDCRFGLRHLSATSPQVLD